MTDRETLLYMRDFFDEEEKILQAKINVQQALIKQLREENTQKQAKTLKLSVRNNRLKGILKKLWAQKQVELEARAVFHQRIIKTRELVDSLDKSKTWDARQFTKSQH